MSKKADRAARGNKKTLGTDSSKEAGVGKKKNQQKKTKNTAGWEKHKGT